MIADFAGRRAERRTISVIIGSYLDSVSKATSRASSGRLKREMARVPEDSAAVMSAGHEFERLGIPFSGDLGQPMQIPSIPKTA
jgi:hypothetical protein